MTGHPYRFWRRPLVIITVIVGGITASIGMYLGFLSSQQSTSQMATGSTKTIKGIEVQTKKEISLMNHEVPIPSWDDSMALQPPKLLLLHYHKTGHDLGTTFARKGLGVRQLNRFHRLGDSTSNLKSTDGKNLSWETYLKAAQRTNETSPVLLLSAVSLPISSDSSVILPNSKLIHFVRKPFDWTISSYLYHRQIPIPSQETGWLGQPQPDPCPFPVASVNNGKGTYAARKDYPLDFVTNVLNISVDTLRNIQQLCESLMSSVPKAPPLLSGNSSKGTKISQPKSHHDHGKPHRFLSVPLRPHTGQSHKIATSSLSYVLQFLSAHDGVRLEATRGLLGASHGDLMIMASNLHLLSKHQNQQNMTSAIEVTQDKIKESLFASWKIKSKRMVGSRQQKKQQNPVSDNIKTVFLSQFMSPIKEDFDAMARDLCTFGKEFLLHPSAQIKAQLAWEDCVEQFTRYGWLGNLEKGIFPKRASMQTSQKKHPSPKNERAHKASSIPRKHPQNRLMQRKNPLQQHITSHQISSEKRSALLKTLQTDAVLGEPLLQLEHFLLQFLQDNTKV